MLGCWVLDNNHGGKTTDFRVQIAHLSSSFAPYKAGDLHKLNHSEPRFPHLYKRDNDLYTTLAATSVFSKICFVSTREETSERKRMWIKKIKRRGVGRLGGSVS